MTTKRSPLNRSIATAVVLGCSTLLLSGCSNDPGEPTVQPSEAKQSVVDFVEQSSSAAGGSWEHLSGPGVRECEQPSGATGTTFVYVMKRADTTGADAKTDVQSVSKHWQGLGIQVEEYQSGGANPVPGVRGRGGPVTSASFNAYPGNYQISATSACSDGVPDKLRSGN
ncbi:hypothetical protein [Curtobacterium sp. PhB25]|uniref:hypothetical protein n=1 Tax=Curtobacterium sp. PhB25 TaxID=2485205 RepID=UPI0010662C2E|nr:hypothetical protein [Curtobacterium sp. PhB25]